MRSAPPAYFRIIAFPTSPHIFRIFPQNFRIFFSFVATIARMFFFTALESYEVRFFSRVPA